MHGRFLIIGARARAAPRVYAYAQNQDNSQNNSGNLGNLSIDVEPIFMHLKRLWQDHGFTSDGIPTVYLRLYVATHIHIWADSKLYGLRIWDYLIMLHLCAGARHYNVVTLVISELYGKGRIFLSVINYISYHLHADLHRTYMYTHKNYRLTLTGVVSLWALRKCSIAVTDVDDRYLYLGKIIRQNNLKFGCLNIMAPIWKLLIFSLVSKWDGVIACNCSQSSRPSI